MEVNKTLFIIGLLMLAGGISFLVLGLTGTFYVWREGVLFQEQNPVYTSTGAGLSVLGAGMLFASFLRKRKK